MQDDKQSLSPEYIRQFNNGYLLSRHEPELADKLSAAFGDSAMFAGFRDGREQYTRERQRETRLPWHTREQNNKNALPMKDKDYESPDKG